MFWFRLARELGMSVRRCMAEVDSAEFTEWLAYALEEPFGPAMDDVRLGTVAAAVYNVNRDTKKRREPYSASDVFAWMNRSKPENEIATFNDPAELKAAIRGSLFGARFKQRNQRDVQHGSKEPGRVSNAFATRR
jgi:hypothetical protein